MEVPLSVEPIVVKGKEQLEIWSNGKQQFINPNSKPYFYTNEKLSIPGTKIEKVKAIQLSNYKEKTFYKYYFETREALTKARIKGKTFEDNIPFILRNRLDNPDIYTKYKHKADLKFLFLDIEQFCKPEEPFPTYEDRIISIAWCTNDRKVKCAYLKKESQTDKELLELFIKQYQKINPDVIVVFNKSYDITTILKRCMRNKIDTSQFSKNDDKPRLIGKKKITIPGVIIYDVWDSVRVDQALTGNVESRKLKPVSDYYGFESKNKVLPGNEISNYIGTKELVGYNKEDVYRLLHLFDIYWPGIEYNANDLKLPLNFVTDMNTTNLGLIVIGDEYKKRNVIADGKNSDRYPEIFQVKREGGNYEGALVGISKTGLFEPVYKADYSCVDEQTEALTNHGWKKYWEINENDELYTWNVEKDIFELEKPSHMNIYDYDDELIYSESWHLSMATTPNHMMYYYKVRGLEKGKLCYSRVDELPTYIDVPITSFYKGKKHKLSDYFKLFAWIITEGSISSMPRIVISQRKCVSLNDSISHIRNILIDLKIHYKETKRKNRPDVEFFFGADTSRMLLSLMENDGKHIPHFIYNATIKEREEFIKELVYGDGTVYKDNHFVLTTCDKEMVNDFQRLCVITGYRTTVNCYSGEYYIHVFRRKVTGLRLNQLRQTKDELYQRKHYKGKVWCPTTKNGTWICRRNNKVHITGNSMYPNIMASFNLSPDTTTLLQYEPYGKFKIEEEENWFIYHIPDKILDRNMVIQVLKKPGFIAELVQKFLDERSKYKKLWKKTDNPIYRAMSDNRKLKANGGVYGVQGAPSHPYGFAPTAVATTGIGRQCGQLLIDILEELYPKSVSDFDTDGVYFDTKNIDKQKIIEIFKLRLKEKFGKELNLSIDIDDYDKGYFYKTKNYVLQRGDKLIFHGVAMKASSKTPMAKSLIREIAKAKLNNQPTDEIIKRYQKLDFPVRDFAMNVTMGMHFSQYKQPQSTLVCQLALAAQRTLGIEPELGNQYYYIKTLNGYKLLEIAQKDEIDKDYYLNEIDKVVKMFGCEVIHGSLQKWGI